MADAYLNVAETVLLSARRPLRPREIIQHAYASQLLPWHLHGPTQDKTLHARMSEDVAYHPETSRFFRTAPGVFFLRELLKDPLIPTAYKEPYYARPRRKELRRERILVLDRLGSRTSNTSVMSIGDIQTELDASRYRFITPIELQDWPDAAVVHSFVLIFQGSRVLSYRSGKFFPDIDPLRGMRSVGLGGAVYASDRDMLFEDMFGIIAGGINEMGHGIGLSKILAERARYENEIRPCLAVRLPRTERRPPVVQVVLAYDCPTDFQPTKAALSVNDLRWVDLHSSTNELDDFDETSRFLIATKRIRRLREMVLRSGG